MYVVFEAKNAEDISQRVFRGVFPTKEEAIDSVVRNHNIRLEDEEYYHNNEELCESIREMLEEHSATDRLSLFYMIEPLENNQWVSDLKTSYYGDVEVNQYLNKRFILFNFDGKESKDFIHRAVYQMVRTNLTRIVDFWEYGINEIKDDKIIQTEIEKLKSDEEIKVIAEAIEHDATFFYFTEDVDGSRCDNASCFVAIYNI